MSRRSLVERQHNVTKLDSRQPVRDLAPQNSGMVGPRTLVLCLALARNHEHKAFTLDGRSSEEVLKRKMRLMLPHAMKIQDSSWRFATSRDTPSFTAVEVHEL